MEKVWNDIDEVVRSEVILEDFVSRGELNRPVSCRTTFDFALWCFCCPSVLATAIRVFDVRTAHPVGKPYVHENEIVKISLSQHAMGFPFRLLAFTDSNSDLYITPVLKHNVVRVWVVGSAIASGTRGWAGLLQFGCVDHYRCRCRCRWALIVVNGRGVIDFARACFQVKLQSMVDSFSWNDASDMLTLCADGELTTYMYPNALFVDRTLLRSVRCERPSRPWVLVLWRGVVRLNSVLCTVTRCTVTCSTVTCCAVTCGAVTCGAVTCGLGGSWSHWEHVLP